MFTWKLFPFAVAIIFVAPIIIVFSSLFGSYSDTWNHLIEFVLVDYVSTSIFLVIGVSIGVLTIGVFTAYAVTNSKETLLSGSVGFTDLEKTSPLNLSLIHI